MQRFVWASYGAYVLAGMTGVIFGSVMVAFITHYHVTFAIGGGIVFIQSMGFMVGVPFVAYLMKHFHYKSILSITTLVIAVVQIIIFFLPPLGWVGALSCVNGIGASAIETAVASYIMESFVGQRAVFMSRLEVSFGLGALVLPAITSGLLALNVWRLSFLVIGCMGLVLAFLWQSVSVTLTTDRTQDQLDAKTAPPPEFKNRRAKYLVLSLFLLLIFAYVGIEGSINGFLPSILNTYLKALPYYASLSTTVFWIAMVCGRLAIGWVARHVNYERYLLWSILGTLLFLIALSQVHILWAAFVIVFALGILMSAIYSIAMVYANHTFPGMERMVTSAVTLVAGIGMAVFPATIGYAMDHLEPGQILLLWVGIATLLIIALLSIFGTLNRLRKGMNVKPVHSRG